MIHLHHHAPMCGSLQGLGVVSAEPNGQSVVDVNVGKTGIVRETKAAPVRPDVQPELGVSLHIPSRDGDQPNPRKLLAGHSLKAPALLRPSCAGLPKQACGRHDDRGDRAPTLHPVRNRRLARHAERVQRVVFFGEVAR